MAPPGAPLAVGVPRLEDGHPGHGPALPDAQVGPLGPQGGQEFVAKGLGVGGAAEGVHVETDRVIVIGMFVARRLGRQEEARHVPQPLGQAGRVRPLPGDVRVQPRELRPGERRRQVVLPVHPPHPVGVVLDRRLGHAVLAEVPQGLAALERRLVIGDEEAALAGAEALVLVGAEGGAVAEGADLVAAEGRPVRLAGVLDHLEAVPPRDPEDRLHVGRQAVQVDGDDRAGARREGGLDPRGVQVHRRPVDVDEHGDRVVVQAARRRRRPRVGRHDHLVARADAAAHQGHVQGGRPRVARQGEPVPVPGGELLLEGLAVGPVRVLAALERPEDHLPVDVLDGRPPAHEAVGHCLLTAPDRQPLAHAAPPPRALAR